MVFRVVVLPVFKSMEKSIYAHTYMYVHIKTTVGMGIIWFFDWTCIHSFIHEMFIEHLYVPGAPRILQSLHYNYKFDYWSSIKVKNSSSNIHNS